MKFGRVFTGSLLLLLCCLAVLSSPPLSAQSAPSSSSEASKVAKYAAEVALSRVGIREVGYNRGPEVSVIIRRAGGQEGQSWCMYFVVDSYMISADKFRVKMPLKRTGSCWMQLKAATLPGSGKKVLLPNMPGGVKLLPGDVAIHSRKPYKASLVGKGFLGHTGLVIEDIGSRYVAVEGNTSCSDKGSQHDGGGVCLKTRSENSKTLPVVAFIRVV